MRKAFDRVVEEGKKLPLTDIFKVSLLATALKTVQCSDEKGCSNGMFNTFAQGVLLASLATVAAQKTKSYFFPEKQKTTLNTAKESEPTQEMTKTN